MLICGRIVAIFEKNLFKMYNLVIEFNYHYFYISPALLKYL